VKARLGIDYESLRKINPRNNHSFGDEVAWWGRRAIDPVATSRMLWISTRRIE
jgi:crotonobetainyl-CoA:carnitine CoA-transferase CaiB-like acyl-CoA transferase